MYRYIGYVQKKTEKEVITNYNIVDRKLESLPLWSLQMELNGYMFVLYFGVMMRQ